MTTTALATRPTTDNILPYLISSHGDVELALERIQKDLDPSFTATDLVSLLAEVDTNKLFRGVRAALSMQLLDTLTVLRHAVINNLSEFQPGQLSKLTVDLFTQLATLTAPVQEGSPTQSINILNNMGLVNDNAREALLKRVSTLDSSFTEGGAD